MAGKKNLLYQQDLVLEEMTTDAKNKMKELSYSYERLSQILKQMPSGSWELTEEDLITILGRTSLEACRGCGYFYECYKNKAEEHLKRTGRLLGRMEKEGTAAFKNNCRDENPLQNECDRAEEFLISLIQSYEIWSVHKIWTNKMYELRKAMASQMEELSRILFGCSLRLGYDRTKESGAEKQLRKMLRREKIKLGAVRFCENQAKKQEVFLTASARKENYPAQKAAQVLSKVLKKHMVPAADCRMSVYRKNTMLHFEEEKNYYILCGNAGCAREKNEVSGDVFSILDLKQGKQICILADGMGSGTEAREESRHVVELMEQFLEAGFREEETVRLANSMLTFGIDRSRYASFDLLSFHLYSGMLKIIKAGSAATFIIRNNKVERICSTTPPSGLWWEVEFDVLYKKLYDGDRIILVSDGVLDRIGGEDAEERLLEELPALCTGSPRQCAQEVLTWAFGGQEMPLPDDMTVLAIYVGKKKHPF